MRAMKSPEPCSVGRGLSPNNTELYGFIPPGIWTYLPGWDGGKKLLRPTRVFVGYYT